MHNFAWFKEICFKQKIFFLGEVSKYSKLFNWKLWNCLLNLIKRNWIFWNSILTLRNCNYIWIIPWKIVTYNFFRKKYVLSCSICLQIIDTYFFISMWCLKISKNEHSKYLNRKNWCFFNRIQYVLLIFF